MQLETSMTSSQHCKNLLQTKKFQWPKPRNVGKSKFANKIRDEISDESSIERRESQLLIFPRQQTDEDIHEKYLKDSIVPQVNVVAGDAVNSSADSIVTKANKLLAQKLMGNLGTYLVGNSAYTDQTEVSNCPCVEVLVADDNEFNLVTFQAMLKMHGIEAAGASNGCEAL